jgi:hypothetical protein
MNCGRLTAIFLGLLVLTGVAQTPQGQRYVVLSSNSESKFPPRLAWDQGSYGSWKPSSEDIQSVEISLYRISEMNIAGWPPQVRIEHPERYFRQYVGVSNRGERRIYINAFCDDPHRQIGASVFMLSSTVRRATGKPYMTRRQRPSQI